MVIPTSVVTFMPLSPLLPNVSTSAQSAAVKRSQARRWGSIVASILIILSGLWLIAALWYQLKSNLILCLTLITIVAAFISALLLSRHSLSWHRLAHLKRHRAILSASYLVVWLIGLAWFVSLTPSTHRDWKPEVAHILSYERDAANPNIVTLHHVRDFDWQDADHAVEHWQSRQVDLNQLKGVDVINSYWMGPIIAHTLVSFEIEGDRPIAFSFEIRKEQGEDFSAIGGFFKQYELSLIASEERDILYTRSNARGEQVYLFPIDRLSKGQLRAMFESYLKAADELQARPAWYNTLTSNCTNIIFYMARPISGDSLPWDYRVWASGWLPNYLYDNHLLPNELDWSMAEWYKQSHINPKVVAKLTRQDNQSDDAYSKLIRQGLPEARIREE